MGTLLFDSESNVDRLDNLHRQIEILQRQYHNVSKDKKKQINLRIDNLKKQIFAIKGRRITD